MNRRKQMTNHKLTAEQKYYILQKSIGVSMMVVSVVASYVIQEAGALIGAALGAGFLFSKEKVLMMTSVYWDENPLK